MLNINVNSNVPNTSVCGEICEVFSRVVGYHRPVYLWSDGKQQEFKERKIFSMGLIKKELAKPSKFKVHFS